MYANATGRHYRDRRTGFQHGSSDVTAGGSGSAAAEPPAGQRDYRVATINNLGNGNSTLPLAAAG